MHKEEVESIVKDVLSSTKSEHEELRKKVVYKIASEKDRKELCHWAINEMGQYLQCYAHDNIEGMIKEFTELSMVMCALMSHYPEEMTKSIQDKAIEGYAEKNEVI